MSQLHRTLYSLKDDNLVESWFAHTDSCATVKVNAEKVLTVCIGDNYYLATLKEVYEAKQKAPALSYVVLNDWQGITGEAEQFAFDQGIEVISYRDFRHRLHVWNGH